VRECNEAADYTTEGVWGEDTCPEETLQDSQSLTGGEVGAALRLPAEAGGTEHLHDFTAEAEVDTWRVSMKVAGTGCVFEKCTE
jgi:hypothetical protein